MVPELGIAVAALVLWLAWRTVGLPGIAAPIGLAVLMLAAWRAGVSRSDARLSAVLRESRQALDTANRQLAATQETLQGSQKMEAIGRLAAGMAHDFNNQLTVISSNVEMLKRSLDGKDGRVPRHADAALQGVQRAAALTSRVLSLSRAPPPEPEAVDVNRLLDGLASLLRRSLGNRIDLELHASQDPWLVWADINRMENALLAVAAEVSDRVPDGGTVIVRAETTRLDAGGPGLLPGDYIQIEVAAPEARRPGERAALGLALALTRGAGGALLSSEALVSYRLLLPRYNPRPPAAPQARLSGGRRATILVVEDDTAVRMACVQVLRDLDYEVLEAADAMEGFRLIADGGGIDLLFTDIGLPGGVSGRALADAVQQVYGGVRVVFTTGYAADDVPHRPGMALLPKPFAPAQLAATVRDALQAGLPATH